MDPSRGSRVLARMTLARTRLWLGITGVGLTVLTATVALWWDLPDRLFATNPTAPILDTVAAALAWPLAWSLLLLPLDVLGGTVAVRHRPRPLAWLRGWLRGIMVQVAVLVLTGTLLVLLSRALGLLGAVAGAALAGALLASLLGVLTRLGASAPLVHGGAVLDQMVEQGEVPTKVIAAQDEAFVGGFSGLVRPSLVIPVSWLALPRETLHGLLVRRRLAAGAPRIRGVALALAWIVFGATVSGLLLGLPSSAAGLVRFSMGTTLWSFLGVLVLPTPSRRAVTALDQQACAIVGPQVVADGITTLDRWQDDEPARHRWVETIFHPVPSRSARLAALDAPAPATGVAWRAARMALPLGLGSWSVLGRAVHCNLGRPTLWWMLPGD